MKTTVFPIFINFGSLIKNRSCWKWHMSPKHGQPSRKTDLVLVFQVPLPPRPRSFQAKIKNVTPMETKSFHPVQKHLHCIITIGDGCTEPILATAFPPCSYTWTSPFCIPNSKNFPSGDHCKREKETVSVSFNPTNKAGHIISAVTLETFTVPWNCHLVALAAFLEPYQTISRHFLLLWTRIVFVWAPW